MTYENNNHISGEKFNEISDLVRKSIEEMSRWKDSCFSATNPAAIPEFQINKEKAFNELKTLSNYFKRKKLDEEQVKKYKELVQDYLYNKC